MKKKITFLFLFFCCIQYSFSQKQANYWYFGSNVGLDFSSGSPTVITNNALNTSEGTAVATSSTGNLLFYTNGDSVLNKNHVRMPNGIGLFGDVSTTQVMVVPNPGDSTLYYIFTLDNDTALDNQGFNYSIVDMTLQGGNGDVATKNIHLKDEMTEKVAAVYHCNNHDIWLMVHERKTNAFFSYLVTDAGINAPIISHVGSTHIDVHGQMKFSNDGKRLACAVGYDKKIEIFNFDNATGEVTSPISLTINHIVYGLEFSPDNSKLYATYYDVASASVLVQFDLNTGPNAADILASKVILGSDSDPIIYSLQLAPDDKIYVTKEITPFLGVVNAPDIAGIACNFTDNIIHLDPLGFGNVCMLGLPSFIQSYFNPSFPNVPCTDAIFLYDTLICDKKCIDFTDTSFSTDPIISWTWQFDGAVPSFSSAQNPTNICYAAPGTYPVKLIVSSGIETDSATHTIIVAALPIVDAGTDVSILLGGSINLNATGNATSYSWTPGTGLSSTSIPNPIASPLVTTTYYLLGIDSNDCEARDTLTVTVIDAPDTTIIDTGTTCEIFIPSAFSPNDDGSNDVLYVRGACIDQLNFVLFNRWGEKVFESSDITRGWDGTYEGKKLNPAVFMYYCDIVLFNKQKISKKGNISLTR